MKLQKAEILAAIMVIPQLIKRPIAITLPSCWYQRRRRRLLIKKTHFELKEEKSNGRVYIGRLSIHKEEFLLFLQEIEYIQMTPSIDDNTWLLSVQMHQFNWQKKDHFIFPKKRKFRPGRKKLMLMRRFLSRSYIFQKTDSTIRYGKKFVENMFF
jgi:hypothetical protein